MKTHAKKCASWGRSITECDCDGYHTFGELYEHRIALYIAFCKSCETMDSIQDSFRQKKLFEVWRSKLHADGTSFEGWFLLGIFKEKGKQITYHLPNDKWDEVSFAETLDRGPEFDNHTSNNVLERLKKL